MRFGRIVKVELLESHIVSPIEGYFYVFKAEESSSRVNLTFPKLKDNWMGLKETKSDEEDIGDFYKVTSKWREFKSGEIKTDDNLGDFPFNIVEWEQNFDIDVEISLEERTSGDEGDYKTENYDKDDMREQKTFDVLVAKVTIYNPPKNLVKEMDEVNFYQTKNIGSEKLDVVDQPFRKIMRIKAGYYGKHGMNVPTIFKGQIDSEEGVEYNDEGEETQITFTVESALELFDRVDDIKNDKVPRTTEDLIFTGKDRRIHNVIKKIIEGRGPTIGRIVKKFKNDEGEEEYIKVKDEFKISKGTRISVAISKAVKKVNENNSLNKNLTVENSMGNVINITPENYKYYSGIVLTPEIGFISLTRRTEEGYGESDKDEESSDKYEIETLFLPEIRYGDVIKLKRFEGDDWNFFKVNDYVHNIPHNDSATTSIACEELKGVELLKYGEEKYDLKTKSPYDRPVVRVTR